MRRAIDWVVEHLGSRNRLPPSTGNAIATRPESTPKMVDRPSNDRAHGPENEIGPEEIVRAAEDVQAGKDHKNEGSKGDRFASKASPAGSLRSHFA